MNTSVGGLDLPKTRMAAWADVLKQQHVLLDAGQPATESQEMLYVHLRRHYRDVSEKIIVFGLLLFPAELCAVGFLGELLPQVLLEIHPAAVETIGSICLAEVDEPTTTAAAQSVFHAIFSGFVSGSLKRWYAKQDSELFSTEVIDTFRYHFTSGVGLAEDMIEKSDAEKVSYLLHVLEIFLSDHSAQVFFGLLP